MSKIHGMMDIGKRSMMNSQTALQTVGHNIANKSTEGYSRQRVEIQSSEATGIGNLRIGTGARAAQVTRINNPYLEKQIGKEQSTLGFFQGRADAMVRVEQVYNEQNNKGLNQFISEFFNAFREFSNNPESLATRTLVKESAEFLTKDFKRIGTQLQDIQEDIDQQILVQINDVNEFAREVATLNEKIQSIEMSGGQANDERDRRDLLIKKLGEKINIRWAEGSDGSVTISAGNSAILVAGHDAMKLEVKATPETNAKDEGRFDIFYVNSAQATPQKVTQQMVGGSIGGLLEVRDKTIGELHNDIDQLAYGISTTVNEIHQRGFDAYNRPAERFFTIPERLRGASRNISLSKTIAEDVNRISAAAQSHAPGDNRVASAISQLQFQNIFNDGTSSVDDYYNSMVGKVGIQARRAESAQQSQADILRQLSNIRESISGVSLDEETTKMIEFQKAFDASARLIRMADEMFDTVINLKRM